jgi:hypothetical protein
MELLYSASEADVARVVDSLRRHGPADFRDLFERTSIAPASRLAKAIEAALASGTVRDDGFRYSAVAPTLPDGSDKPNRGIRLDGPADRPPRRAPGGGCA